MTPGELAAVRGRLEEFAAEMFAPLTRRDQRDKGGTCVRGLLLDGRRKSMQPMAERLGVDEQGLRKKTFGKKAEADRFAATVEADKHRCQDVDHADRTTVVEYARAWAAAARTGRALPPEC